MHHIFLTLLKKTESVSSLVICYLGGGYIFACSMSFLEVKAAHLMKCDVFVLQAGRSTVL